MTAGFILNGMAALMAMGRSGRAIHSTDPNFVRGDWYGDARKQFFWYRFKLEGDGAEQAVTCDRTVLRVYGYRGSKPKQVTRDSGYKRNSIANHTHY
jgi:hypothetical protein